MGRMDCVRNPFVFFFVYMAGCLLVFAGIWLLFSFGRSGRQQQSARRRSAVLSIAVIHRSNVPSFYIL